MNQLENYAAELRKELHDILEYWMKYTVDSKHGGFYGSVDHNNSADLLAPKGLVLHARILWSFSAAYQYAHNQQYLEMATRAYDYLRRFFTDNEYGGAYWAVDYSGSPLSDRKQIYGLAFYLYGLSEYYAAGGDPAVLEEAIRLFKLIEEKSFDTQGGGYWEAFSRDWQSLDDMRLSEKDANEKKTMNTHLHVVEAYANLYRSWPDPLLRNRIQHLLRLFDEHIIDKNSGHLLLFFNENWQPRPDVVSYGHDIEAAWLLQECAAIIDDKELLDIMKGHAIPITNAAMEGLDTDGGLWYEYEPAAEKMVKEKHWWPQAEAMVGFFNAWEISGNNIYLQAFHNSWNFIKGHIRINNSGEWAWGVYADYRIMQDKDKAGFWKCPYHNSRACLEIIKRIERLDLSSIKGT